MVREKCEISSGYSQMMKAKLFDIETGKLICLLNEKDAGELGVFPLDRVELTNPSAKKCMTTVVDTTDSMVGPDQIGIYEDVQKILKAKKSARIRVSAVPRPESVKFIQKKIRKGKLSEEELRTIVKDIGDNKLSDVELGAFLTAIFINGYDLEETVAMTKALRDDGKQLKISKAPIVDKHSVGGTNGRTTMIVIPIVASAGLFIPKTSSRAITSPAGTADAMEVLAKVGLPLNKIKNITEKHGGVIVWGGSLDLAPVDDKIIKVEHPLSLDPDGQVIASVMAKKASVGAKYVVIDLPVGPEAKIKTRKRAEEMALKFLSVGESLGMKVNAVITNGEEPSGPAFGPALEAKHAMKILEGKVFDNLAQKSCELAGVLFELCGKTKKGKGYSKAKNILESKQALKKMKAIIKAQGAKATTSTEIKDGKYKIEIKAKESGEIHSVNLGNCIDIARAAGAPADHYAGLLLEVEAGDTVKKKEVLFTIYSSTKRKLEAAEKIAKSLEVVQMERIILEEFV